MSGANQTLQAMPNTRALLVEQGQVAVAAIEQALGLPPLQFNREAEVAERAVVQMRDHLIDRLRRDGTAAEAPGWRATLKQVNTALSLIVGVEYPSVGERHKPLEQARDLLKDLLDDGQAQRGGGPESTYR